MEKMLKTRGTNYLLVKSELGKGRPATISLPGEEFTYGYPNKYEKDIMKKLTSSWSVTESSIEKLPSIDYIKINKAVCKK